MIDWAAILIGIPLGCLICFTGWVLLEYPFIMDKEKSLFKTFTKWYKNLS